MNALEAFNNALFLMINGTPALPAWQIDAGLLIAVYFIHLLWVLLIAIWLKGDAHQRSVVLHACLVVLLGSIAKDLLSLFWQHPRPFVIGLGYTFLAHAPNSSFPSAHATTCFGIALTLLFGHLRWPGALALLISCAVAWSRVFIGVHYPLDMLGALITASLVYALSAPLWRRVGPQLTDCVIGFYRKLFAWPIRRGWLRR